MSDYIPPDIIPIILSKLPIKSLLRFTLVCKSWRAMIKDSSFVTTHLKNHHGAQLLLVHKVSGETCYSSGHKIYFHRVKRDVCSLHYDNPGFDCEVSFHFEIDARGDIGSECFRVVGVCKGVVCLSDDLDGVGCNFILWNPSIRKLVTLPGPRVAILGHYIATLGFGFDAITNDYKVVRLITSVLNSMEDSDEDDDWQITERQTFVEVFSLAEGSWSYPTRVGLECAIHECSPQAFVNGALHWAASSLASSLDRDIILAFDVGSEVFREIMMPNSSDRLSVRSNPEDLTYRLSVSGDGKSLALFTRFHSNQPLNSFLHIWVMREYYVEDSWTKLITLRPQGPERSIPKAFYIRRRGEVVLVLNQWQGHTGVEHSNDLFSLDIVSRERRHLGIRQHQYYSINAYEESIVLLNRNDAVSC